MTDPEKEAYNRGKEETCDRILKEIKKVNTGSLNNEYSYGKKVCKGEIIDIVKQVKSEKV